MSSRRATAGVEAFATRCGIGLEPFQTRIIRAVLRGTPEVVVLLPRGCGKSTLAALLGLWRLVDSGGAKVNFVASTREQAAIAYEHAAGFAHRLGDARLKPTVRELRLGDFGGFLRVRPGDPNALQGLDSDLAIYDEAHVQSTDDVYVVLLGSLKRPGAQLLTISTAARSADSPLGRLRARALALPGAKRRGAVVEARSDALHWLEWSCPEDTKLSNVRRIMAANPASFRTRERILSLRESMPEASFRRYIMNQHAVSSEGSWLAPGAWDACRADYEIEPGEKVWAGLDVGGSRSATALCWVTEDLRVGIETWQGAESVLWARAGLEALAARQTVREVAFDPWHAGEIALDLGDRLRFVEFPQNASRLGPATAQLTAVVQERRLKHPGDETLDRHVADCVLRSTPRGDVISKAGGKHSSVQIDAVVALAMAADRALAPKPKPVRFLGYLGEPSRTM